MKVPVVSIGITGLVSALLGIIYVGSTAVFNAVVSLAVSGFFGSYILPFSLLLHKGIANPEQLPKAPYSLGQWGVLVNAWAIAWTSASYPNILQQLILVASAICHVHICIFILDLVVYSVQSL